MQPQTFSWESRGLFSGVAVNEATKGVTAGLSEGQLLQTKDLSFKLSEQRRYGNGRRKRH
jgi:hypothetical protein